MLQLIRQNEHFFLCSQNRIFQCDVCEVSVKLSEDIATKILMIFLLFPWYSFNKTQNFSEMDRISILKWTVYE